jgi:hypothetical protein
MPPEIPVLLDLLDEAFDKKSWHGPNLRGSLRGLSGGQAAWRPAPGRHSIWELAVHAAYWKYVVRRRLTREKRGSFSRPGSNWFPLPKPSTDSAWRAEIGLLICEHAALRQAVAQLPRGGRREFHLIRGAAAHDLYHAGQIRLLRRLMPLHTK